jgi:gliding motility-associated-like protein
MPLFLNVITPDNDGVNDTWKSKSDKILSMRFSIFNRWGNEIISSSENSWNGKDNTGNDVPADVYFYMADVKIDYEETWQYKGYIQVIKD